MEKEIKYNLKISKRARLMRLEISSNGSVGVVVPKGMDYNLVEKFFIEKNKLIAILSPSNENKCSILIKRTGAKIVYLNDHHSKLKLSPKEKTPNKDGTL